MGFEQLLRFIFVVYCATVGVILILAPWTPGWPHLVARLPFSGFDFLSLSWWRGGLTGFGLVHLVWGLHDLNHLLRPRYEYDSDETNDPPFPGHQ